MWIIIIKIIMWVIIFLYTMLTIMTIKSAIDENKNNKKFKQLYEECHIAIEHYDRNTALS